MESAFGKRLFRLFLVFSLVPALILAAIGYYLASHESLESYVGEPEGLTEIAEYYNEFIFNVIRAELNRVPPTTSPPGQPLHFIIAINDTAFSLVAASPLLTTGAAEKIVQAARFKQHGFVEIDSLFYQFYVIENSPGSLLAGGFIHPASYADKLLLLRSNFAAVSSQRALTSDYILFLAVLFLALAAITAALAYYFSSRLSKNLASPLARLSQASKKIAGGDFEQQVEASGIGEVKTLIENFNTMARQLRATTSRLARAERVAAWRNVARKFAHELKNPLQPIMVSVYRLESKLRDSPQYRDLEQPLRAASEELKHLAELAERFSQLAKLPEPQVEPVNLNEFLRLVSDLYGDRLTECELVLELPPDTVTAQIDQTYFREVLHNLLQNATDASAAGARIELSLRSDGSSALIAIRDYGHGMTDEIASSACLPYFTTRKDGSGIGLAVVDKIVSELGGGLVIDSKEGEGTTITVSIPLQYHHGRKNPDS